MLIGSNSASAAMVNVSGEIDIDVDELVSSFMCLVSFAITLQSSLSVGAIIILVTPNSPAHTLYPMMSEALLQ